MERDLCCEQPPRCKKDGGVQKPHRQSCCPKSGVLTMDWEAARAHCKEKDWKWTLDLIDKYQKEMEELKDENVKLRRQLVLRSQINK